MEEIEVFYSCNKAGTYIQFRWPVNCCELNELIVYDKILQKQIQEDFAPLIKEFDLDFSTESSYLVHDGEKKYLVICLQGKTTPELESSLSKAGIKRRDY